MRIEWRHPSENLDAIAKADSIIHARAEALNGR
jgi:hypothetical protein